MEHEGLEMWYSARTRTGAVCLLAALLVLTVSIPLTMPVAGDVRPSGRAITRLIINELLYDPMGTDNNGEFVELYNDGGSAVDLEAWTLSDQDGTGPDVVFHGIVMPAKGFMVISTGAGTNDTDLSDGVGHLFLGKNLGMWSNTGDDCLLSDATGATVDYLAYGAGESVDPPPADNNWSGAIVLVPEGYSIGRLPDGNGTASPKYYRPLLPTMSAGNALDPPPVIYKWGVDPEAPMELQDLLVWANVSDGVRVSRVIVHVDAPDGTGWDQDMDWSGPRARYEATVVGRPGGENLNMNVVAEDPIGQSAETSTRTIGFTANASAQLIVDLHGPEASVMPGEAFKVTGRVSLSNGSKVSGQATGTIPSTLGSWSANFTDYLDLFMVAPTTEGSYKVDVEVKAGDARASETLGITVEWPHKSLLCSLTRVNNATNDQRILTGLSMTLEGKAWFSDGLPAKNVEATIMIVGTGTELDAKTDVNGTLTAVLKAPAVAGSYDIVWEVKALGKTTTTTLTLEVADALHLSVSEVVKMPLVEGDNVSVTGHLTHHDGSPVSGALIVIEFLKTSHKVRTFTGPDGNFSTALVAPFYEGEYGLRVTAVSGTAVASRTDPILVASKGNGAKGAPGLEAPAAILSIVLALWLRRRARGPTS